MNTEILNKAQADALFHWEAVLLGKEDGVPQARAEELFGVQAVRYALKKYAPGDGWNNYGTEDYRFNYLAYKGFLAVVSYHNAEQIRDRVENRKGPTEPPEGD